MVGFTSIMAVTALVSVKDCGAGKAAFNIRELSISPTTVNPGDSLRLRMQYEVPQGLIVTGGTANYLVKYSFIPIPPTVESLCSNLPCPLGQGLYMNETVTTWPTGLTGPITTTITWKDDSSKLLACFAIDGKNI